MHLGQVGAALKGDGGQGQHGRDAWERKKALDPITLLQCSNKSMHLQYNILVILYYGTYGIRVF